MTEDGGDNWRRIAKLPGVPENFFVNDIKADLFDDNTVYVAVDNHKNGDFRPFLLKSTDRGRSWTSIAQKLPPRHLVWRLVQDHVKPGLLFVGTEFGVHATFDGGDHWIRLSLPTVAVRDLALYSTWLRMMKVRLCRVLPSMTGSVAGDRKSIANGTQIGL